MIREFHISNFKSHIDSLIRFGNLTILTGINGSGKTATTQALLLLRQSFLNNRLSSGLDLNKPLCSIGLGQDALSRQASNGTITLKLVISDNTTHSFSFDAGNGLDASFLKRSDKQTDYPDIRELESIALFNSNFHYIGASRWGGRSIFPKDTFAVEQLRQISIEYGQGELIAHFLNRYGIDDCYNYYDNQSSDLSLKAQTIYWEQKISPNVTIDSQMSANNADSYIIKYGFKSVGPTDKTLEGLKAENIGFGISYALPVIVALLSAKEGSLVIIENPEAHLHPAGQAELARLIAKVAAKGIQVIVETHSDHIITGIQIACKEHTSNPESGISKENVVINYMTVGKRHSSKIDEIEIGDNGILKHAPKGFFNQAELDFIKLYD